MFTLEQELREEILVQFRRARRARVVISEDELRSLIRLAPSDPVDPGWYSRVKLGRRQGGWVIDLVEEDRKAVLGDAVHSAFEYWAERLGKTRAKLTPSRRTALQARIKEGYDLNRIRTAIDGCASSPFHTATGKYKGSRRYDDLTLICRSGEKLEQFEEMGRAASEKRRATEDRRANGVVLPASMKGFDDDNEGSDEPW